METKLNVEIEWGGKEFKKWIVRLPDNGPTLFTIHDCANSRKVLGLVDKEKVYRKNITIEDKD